MKDIYDKSKWTQNDYISMAKIKMTDLVRSHGNDSLIDYIQASGMQPKEDVKTVRSEHLNEVAGKIPPLILVECMNFCSHGHRFHVSRTEFEIIAIQVLVEYSKGEPGADYKSPVAGYDTYYEIKEFKTIKTIEDELKD